MTAHHSTRTRRLAAVTLGLLALGCLFLLRDGSPRAQAQPQKSEPPKAAPAPELPEKVAEVVRTINTKLEAGWKANNFTPSKPCDDYEFIRRASLDIIGRIARPEEVHRYLKDPPATRRTLLIERLLRTEEYALYWGDLWANWLLTRSGVFGRGEYREDLALWLADGFALNRPYHEMARDLITATGDNQTNGAVNFILAHVGEPNPPNKRATDGQFEMVPITSRITRLFLGIQTQCVQCHDHPFDNKLKQNMFWEVNAYLRQVERRGNPPQLLGPRGMNYPALELRDNAASNARAQVFYEKRNGVILPASARLLEGAFLPRDSSGLPVSGLARRAELAQRIIEHDNFGRAIVNRMWAHFMGRGFSMPLDDFNEQNPVAYPDLLDELAAKYRHYAYDPKTLIRWICNSNLYHLSSQTNPTNDKPDAEPYFSRMLLKALSPEQLFDSLEAATTAEGVDISKTVPKARRDAWLNSLITNFGDDEGNEVSFNGTVVQALMMMNGREINDAIMKRDGMVAQATQRRRFEQRGVIADLYLSALNRPPTEKEIKLIQSKLPLYRNVRDKDPAGPYHDLFWALLNSSEFILNH